MNTIYIVILLFLQGRFYLKISKNSTHEKKILTYIYTQKKKQNNDIKPTTNSLSNNYYSLFTFS